MEQWMQDYCDAFEEANGSVCTLVADSNSAMPRWTITNASEPMLGGKSYTKTDILRMTQILWDRLKT